MVTYGNGQFFIDGEPESEEFKAKEWQQPIFYKGTFSAKEKKDSFIHLEHFTKGFVVVNGFNLGRYWEINPQKSLYLPASLLKDENELLVFDEKPSKEPVSSILDYHTLDAIKTEDNPETIV